jgi:hypothetical protein
MIFFRIAGIILIVFSIAYVISFFALNRTFGYPGITRKPTNDILRRFADGGPRLIAFWYAFAMSAVLIIPMSLFFQLVFVESHRYLATSAAVVGALNGLVQAVALFRWIFLVPNLAKQYSTPSDSPATRDAVAVVFHAVHRYVGIGIGEHLGSLLTGVWTLLISSMMFSTPIYGSTLAIVGMVAAIAILVGLMEPVGWKAAATINTIGYLVWAGWLLVSGVILLGVS